MDRCPRGRHQLKSEEPCKAGGESQDDKKLFQMGKQNFRDFK